MTEWNEGMHHPQALGEQLRHSDSGVRVEAARQLIALGQNGGSEAQVAQTAAHLARLLSDDEHAVRITAAHGLIGLRAAAVRPTLEALARDVQSAQMRGAAHHVLLALYELGCLNSAETLVLHALEGPDPAANAARALPAALHV